MNGAAELFVALSTRKGTYVIFFILQMEYSLVLSFTYKIILYTILHNIVKEKSLRLKRIKKHSD